MRRFIKSFGCNVQWREYVKIRLSGTKELLRKVVKVNLVPTNLPIIPKDSTGVFPFTFSDAVSDPKPILNDPNFTKNGSLYNTTEAFMNVYGTFDFIDLGVTPLAIDGKMNALGTSSSNYIFKITGASLTTPIYWRLSDPFKSLAAIRRWACIRQTPASMEIWSCATMF